MLKVNNILNIEKKDNYYILTTNAGPILLYFLSDDIIRVRSVFDNSLEEESYILTLTAWEDRLDKFLSDERTKITPLDISYSEYQDTIEFKTRTLKLVLYKENFAIKIFNLKNELIYSDVRGKSMIKDYKDRVKHYSEIFDKDRFYGFGEQTGRMNKLGKFMRLSPKDSIGYDPESTSCLYKHIPFYIKINENNKHALGLFYHNTYESIFNMGNEKSGYWPYYSYFEAEGGDIDIFFINGPEFKSVVDRYTQLTGRTYFAPKYSLGYLGSTMYYVELPENCDKEILDFIDENSKYNIPIDGFQLSSGYTTGSDNKRYVFTWNNQKFENPETFFKDMEEKGVVTSPNIKPGVLLTHPMYEEWKQKGVFVKDPVSGDPYVDAWWGGLGSFFDFTNPIARAEWSKHLKSSLIEKGVHSIWNDNNEYDSVEDREAICNFEGKPSPISRFRAVQSNIMAKIGNKTIEETYPNTRAFSVNRCGSAGIQRYASSWAGDNKTCWEALKYNISTILNMGLCGVANYGADIGGFFGPAPDEELLVRWVQNGIFMPRFSIHSSNNDNTVTEPWMYTDKTKYIVDAINLRYKFIPYMYSLLRQASISGTPILRPLFFEFQNDLKCYDFDTQFMFGESIMVANVLESNIESLNIYLPDGSYWYDYYTREKYSGGQIIQKSVNISSIPIFIKENSIIPMTKELSNINKQVISHVDLLISHDSDSEFTLYDDDGKTLDYKNGVYLETKINVKNSDILTISFEKSGTYNSTIKTVCLDIVNKEKGPLWVKINNQEIKQFINRKKFESSDSGWYYSNSKRSVLIKYNELNSDYSVDVSFAKFDLLGMIEE